jgi:hypothetical protein
VSSEALVLVAPDSFRMPCCSIPSWPADSPADVTSVVVCFWNLAADTTASPAPMPTPSSAILYLDRPPAAASSPLAPDAACASPEAFAEPAALSWAAAVVSAPRAARSADDANWPFASRARPAASM